MGEFIRDRLPDPISYFEVEGLALRGPGKWKTTRCEFHDGSDSMRVNTETGGWVCMACGEKGGDVLAYSMRRHGLKFVEAARTLGAYVDDGKPHRGSVKPAGLPMRDCMTVIAFELVVFSIIVSDLRRGIAPSEADMLRLWQAVGRIGFIVDEATR